MKDINSSKVHFDLIRDKNDSDSSEISSLVHKAKIYVWRCFGHSCFR